MYKKQASTMDQAGGRNKKKKGKLGQDDIEDDFW
jgi:hypothetical protein